MDDVVVRAFESSRTSRHMCPAPPPPPPSPKIAQISTPEDVTRIVHIMQSAGVTLSKTATMGVFPFGLGSASTGGGGRRGRED